MYRPFVVLTLAVWALVPAAASAQPLPAGPVSAFDGRLAVGAEVVATIGDAGRRRVFQLHGLRAQRAADVPGGAVGVLAPRQPGGGRGRDPVGRPQFGAAVRGVHPCPAVDQPRLRRAGRTHPPSFGAFGRRGYQGSDNPLIGYPLAYQYLTSLRPDAAPATVADLLVMRGRGWRTSYPIGSQDQEPGVPLISAFRWDTGIQAHWEGRAIDITGERHDRHARRSHGRRTTTAASRCRAGSRIARRRRSILGASAARGEFFDRDVTRALPDLAWLARADRPRRRRRVLARILAAPERARVEPLERPVRDASVDDQRGRARCLGRGPLPSDPADCRLRPRRQTGLLAPRRRSESDADLGRERVARSRPTPATTFSATSSSDSPCSTTIGTAVACASEPTFPDRSHTGSDAVSAIVHAARLHRPCHVRGQCPRLRRGHRQLRPRTAPSEGTSSCGRRHPT